MAKQHPETKESPEAKGEGEALPPVRRSRTLKEIYDNVSSTLAKKKLERNQNQQREHVERLASNYKFSYYDTLYKNLQQIAPKNTVLTTQLREELSRILYIQIETTRSELTKNGEPYSKTGYYALAGCMVVGGPITAVIIGAATFLALKNGALDWERYCTGGYVDSANPYCDPCQDDYDPDEYPRVPDNCDNPNSGSTEHDYDVGNYRKAVFGGFVTALLSTCGGCCCIAALGGFQINKGLDRRGAIDVLDEIKNLDVNSQSIFLQRLLKLQLEQVATPPKRSSIDLSGEGSGDNVGEEKGESSKNGKRKGPEITVIEDDKNKKKTHRNRPESNKGQKPQESKQPEEGQELSTLTHNPVHEPADNPLDKMDLFSRLEEGNVPSAPSKPTPPTTPTIIHHQPTPGARSFEEKEKARRPASAEQVEIDVEDDGAKESSLEQPQELGMDATKSRSWREQSVDRGWCSIS